MSEKYKVADFLGSMTGYEKIAVKNAFGVNYMALASDDQPMFMNALALVHFKRQGKTDAEAKDAALNLTDKDITALFDLEEEDEEAMPDEPVTEAGKDDSPTP